ncbi:hypothetical protein T492DRAFT_895745 [Pavlovales sp. CCMP2436]|nr:hypothetical protein T492DRAFT_895745 [Pavlovales sp. CCMP2436]
MGRIVFALALALFATCEAHVASVRRPFVAHTAVRRVAVARPRVAEVKAALPVGMAARIVQGATQGAVGAVVAATLSAFTEPVVNRILVQRISVMESINQLDMAKSRKFFMTTLPTNFLKFPLFEAVNLVMQVRAPS